MTFKRVIISFIIILILACAGSLLWLRQELQAPKLHSQSEQYIAIPKGSTPDQIINNLESLGVIRRGWLLKLYVRVTGSGQRLKAGEYRFSSPISPLAVLKKLEEGEQRLSRLTVIEGWTRWDIAALLARIPELKLQSAEEALALLDDTSAIRDLDPEAKNLEGYLYPDTYSFPPDVTPRQVVETMVKRFRQVWGELSAQHATPPGLTPREVVTVASLIETEAKLKDERPLVSSVIYNRLRRDIPLGIDSTVIYASKAAGKWRNNGKVYQSDLDRDSPYNTRKVRGLPPGPIASPGQSSLEAALKPAQTDYIYYVREPSRNDGAHNFYSNEADFQRGVQALREWERNRNANLSATPTPSEGTDVPAQLSPSP
ncbi:MAG TPA: endolytic transglycosylase MltG [Pyrinomonadaceae bacterium]|nr:endolytic transglycosylase MltG [Pyrinomonadaceae bacterium]